MKKILDKIVVGFFVVILGFFWYCSTRYYVKPDHHKIVIYDVDDEHFIDGKTQCAFIKEKAIWFGEVEPELIVDIRLIKPSRFNFIYNKRLKKIFTKYSEHCMIMHVLGQWPDNFEKWIRSYYV